MRLAAVAVNIAALGGCDVLYGLERPDTPEHPTDVVELATGARATCVRLREGTVWCWGESFLVTSGMDELLPVRMPIGGSPAIAVSSGDAGTCVVLEDHRALCWGPNHRGALGVGDDLMHLAPAAVVYVNNVVATDIVDVSVGTDVTCFIRTNGSIACAGAGRLVGNASATDQSSIAAADNIVNATALAAGERHVCAVEMNGSVSCWGDNERGQLGTGTFDPELRPVPVSGTYSMVAAGDRFTCAIDLEHRLVCWGSNGHGELGEGTMIDRSIPRPAPLDHVVAIGAAAQTGYAARDDGTVWSWGGNSFGELGDGTMVERSTPGQLTDLPPSADVGAGTGLHACAFSSDGDVYCWGWNSLGQLGDGTTTDSALPTRVNLSF